MRTKRFINGWVTTFIYDSATPRKVAKVTRTTKRTHKRAYSYGGKPASFRIAQPQPAR